MPYIPPADREPFDAWLGDMPDADDPGTLNYVVTNVVLRYLRGRGAIRYRHVNDVVGVYR